FGGAYSVGVWAGGGGGGVGSRAPLADDARVRAAYLGGDSTSSGSIVAPDPSPTTPATKNSQESR
ncbi:MAG: hypothetical protein L0H26_05800, partial [Microlunatus sp.]|nr:hypothetical protein [Microlunatus sp.]